MTDMGFDVYAVNLATKLEEGESAGSVISLS